jgi:DNA-binding FadR family transcriptional regulator
VSDSAHFYEADIEFHMAIFAASHNGVIGRMSAMLRPLLEASFRLQREANEKRGLHGGYDVHRAVYVAISKRQPERAAAAMEKLLDRALTEI